MKEKIEELRQGKKMKGKAKPTPRDGDCFFHALVHYGFATCVSDARTKIASYMRDNMKDEDFARLRKFQAMI